jgi:glucose-6-phosphate dehydrogenase assembly protein OpcA
MQTELEPEEMQRAALFNLVLHIRDPERADYVRKVSQRVRDKFPCRIITLTESTATSVSIETIGTEILCDQVEIGFAPDQSERLPYLVLPQLLPDLPLYLFWAGKPDPDDPLFTGLQPYITRLIYDPDTLDEIPQFVGWLNSKRFHGELSDLKWAHLDGWRLVLASVFNAPDRFPAIARAKQLQIRYSSHPTAFARDPSLHALYLQSWFAARLGWRFLRRGDNQFSYSLSDGRTVEVTLTEEETDLYPFGSILSIETLSHEEEHTRFTLEENFVKVSSDSPEKCGIPYSLYLPKASRSVALVNELFKKGTSDHYREMVKQLELL